MRRVASKPDLTSKQLDAIGELIESVESVNKALKSMPPEFKVELDIVSMATVSSPDLRILRLEIWRKLNESSF